MLGEDLRIPAELMPEVSAGEALRLVLQQAAGERIAPLPDPKAIELLGWLELPLDDAPALVVVGVNEGIVPSSLNADLFLPNQLRRVLGIEDNARRYARDAYAMSVLCGSRERLRVIAGRRTSEGDPLVPSRLLFACDGPTMARRASAYFGSASSEEIGRTPHAPREGARHAERDEYGSGLEVPRPRPLTEPVTSMRVTEFRDYLACPYRYYLRHRAPPGAAGRRRRGTRRPGLRVVGPRGPAALRRRVFGRRDRCAARSAAFSAGRWTRRSASATAPNRCRRSACRPSSSAPGCWHLADWQAGWAAAGWRIEHVEWQPEEGQARLMVDGQPMFLRGRIDRIDVHPSEGRMIFDYKSSNQADSPEKTHRRQGQWVDLQLPLYRHLAAALGLDGPIELAYIVLPKDVRRVGPLPAEWTRGRPGRRRRGGRGGGPQGSRGGVLAAGQPAARLLRRPGGHLPGQPLIAGSRRRAGKGKTRHDLRCFGPRPLRTRHAPRTNALTRSVRSTMGNQHAA